MLQLLNRMYSANLIVLKAAMQLNLKDYGENCANENIRDGARRMLENALDNKDVLERLGARQEVEKEHNLHTWALTEEAKKYDRLTIEYIIEHFGG